MSNNTIELNFLGKDYEFNCPIDQQAQLRQAAAVLDEKMKMISAHTNASREAIILMAALNLSFELQSNCPADEPTHSATELAQLAEINRRVSSLIENIGVAKR